MKTTKTCLECGKEYSRPASLTSTPRWQARKYCGHHCRGEASRKYVEDQASKKCALCSQQFYKPVADQAISHKRWEERKYCSNDCWRKAYLTNSERPNAYKPTAWSDNYSAIHGWVNRNFEQKQKCELCSRQGDGRQLQWANISDRYLRERSDWACLCSRCHKVFDCSKWVSKQSAQFQKNFKYLLDKASSHTEKDD